MSDDKTEPQGQAYTITREPDVEKLREPVPAGVDQNPLVPQQAGRWESPGEAGTCPGARRPAAGMPTSPPIIGTCPCPRFNWYRSVLFTVSCVYAVSIMDGQYK